MRVDGDPDWASWSVRSHRKHSRWLGVTALEYLDCVRPREQND